MPRRQCKNRKNVLLRRKEPKTFFRLLPNDPDMSWIYPQAPEAKVFWFFSSEKNILNDAYPRPDGPRGAAPAGAVPAHALGRLAGGVPLAPPDGTRRAHAAPRRGFLSHSSGARVNPALPR
jgi:hypothetical protein